MANVYNSNTIIKGNNNVKVKAKKVKKPKKVKKVIKKKKITFTTSSTVQK